MTSINDKGLEAAARILCELNTTEDDYYWHQKPPMTNVEYVNLHWIDWVDDARDILAAYLAEDQSHYYRLPEMEHEAEEYECAMLALDTMKVPRDVDGQTLSIVERIKSLATIVSAPVLQEPLGNDFSKILHDNLWDLYEDGDENV